MKQITIYTDGACKGNPGPGGYGVLLQYIDKHGETVSKELSGHFPNTTNNQMELTACIKALEALKEPCAITLYSDSRYVINGITDWIIKWRRNGFRKSPNSSTMVKNHELWKTLDELNKTHDIKWTWVKGHSDNPGNEIADQLASNAALSQ